MYFVTRHEDILKVLREFAHFKLLLTSRTAAPKPCLSARKIAILMESFHSV